jgi:hypothetical protein
VVHLEELTVVTVDGDDVRVAAPFDRGAERSRVRTGVTLGGNSVKLTRTRPMLAGTVTYGIPYAPPPPKSAWRNPGPSASTWLTMFRESVRGGVVEMLVFHALSAGNTGKPFSGPF